MKGSPPYTWGIPRNAYWIVTSVRITPIYVGNTLMDIDGEDDTEDHPHIRGEYIKASGIRSPHLGSPHLGSPPYTWGIPGSSLQTSPGCGDHPHIRGEYLKAVTVKLYEVGSPPYTWGIPQVQAQVTSK